MGDVLGARALNRATLERQMLLRRAPLSAEAAVEHLVGMQAQAPIPPYFGLWTRLEGFRPDELADAILGRRLVRIVVMRGTIHLVTARDALTLRPWVQPILDRDLRTNAAFGPRLAGMDLDALAAAARAVLEERPRTGKELGLLLRERWPDRDPAALAHAARDLLPLVQVPPRGIWGRGGQPTLATAEAWLGRPLEHPSPEEIVLRYLGAFGPATVADAQTWSGLTRLGEVFDRLRPRLRVFRDARGRELFDLPDAPRPDPDAPAPPRFLAEWDNLLLSHADRARVISDEDRRRIFTVNGIFPGTILIDGMVHGTWKLVRERGAATLRVEAFRPVPEPDRTELAAEGERLLAWAAPDAETRDVQILEG